nr:hypothetical protein [Tanacetum cinerariifolium]
LNLRTIGQSKRFVISSDSFHHYSTNAGKAGIESFIRMRTEYFLSERRSLEFECEKQADLLKARDVEVEKLKEGN